MNIMKKNQKKRVVTTIALIILVIEFLVMILLSYFPYELSLFAEASLDVILLTSFSTPLIYFFVIQGFIASRDEAIAEMSELAHTDHLTKLANRRMLVSHLDSFLAHSARHKICGALIQIDLDGFKAVNDTYGHDIGDLVLIDVAKRMKQATRAEDFISRIGGDEFIILIPQVGGDTPMTDKKIMLIADKILMRLKEPMLIKNNSIHISASIGIRMLRGTQANIGSLMKDVDSAMYRAKQAGKGRAVIY